MPTRTKTRKTRRMLPVEINKITYQRIYQNTDTTDEYSLKGYIKFTANTEVYRPRNLQCRP